MTSLEYQYRNLPTYFGTWFFPKGRVFWKLYVYFRWLDDIVDDPKIAQSEKARLLGRQRQFLEQAFIADEGSESLCHEEALMRDAIRTLGSDAEFRVHVFRLFETFVFDAGRFGGRRVTRNEFLGYSRAIGDAYVSIAARMMRVSSVPERFQTEFRRKYGTSVQSALAEYAHCCHLVHVLRDRVVDVEAGYDNLPIEYDTFEAFSSEIFRYVLRKFMSVEYEHFFLLVKYRVNVWLALAAFCYYARFVTQLTRFDPQGRSGGAAQFSLTKTVARFVVNRFYYLDAFESTDVLDVQHQQVCLEACMPSEINGTPTFTSS